MKRMHLIKRAAAPALAAACVITQVGGAFAATGSVNGALTYASGTWQQEEAGWKHMDAQGVMSTGWLHKESGWYYLDPVTGIMKTGWFQDTDGKWYYFEKAGEGVEGRLHSGWLQTEDGSWYFLNTLHDGAFGAMLTGFQWIAGSCYYLTEEGADLGKMLFDTTLPDGQQLDASGRLLNENGVVRHDQQGLPETEQINRTAGNGSGSSGSGGGSSSGGSGSGGSSGGGNTGGSGSDDGSGSGGSGDDSDTGDSGSGDDSDTGDSGSGDDSGTGGSGSGGSGDGSGTGGSGSGGSGDGSGTGGSGSGGSGDGSGSEEETSLIDETRTGYQITNDLGYWLPIVFDEGYNADNTVITVDGQVVNDSLTDVTTDGSIAKLALLSKPKTLTVTDANDSSKSETVEIGGTGANAVYANADGYLPEKILTHGPVATWDYYLTNYDEDGNVRISPKRTTFNLGEEIVQHPSYSPDAELDKDGNATVTILFNYNTEEEKAWFDGITGYELVSYDERRDTLNAHLEGAREANVSHGSGKVGEITIKAPQSNFYNNGRYYVRVKSSAGSAALVPIHLVNQAAPAFKVRETAQSGKNLHFAVENMVYAIETPIERVTLEDPTGDVRELRYIDDWFLYSQDLFVLYNDVEAEDGRNNLQYNGNYTMTIYSNGFKTVSVKFHVSDGIDVPAKARSSASFNDGISMATAGSGGSSGGSGSETGGLAISANLIFDSDLLVNAYLLEQLDMANDASTAVLDWWYGVIVDAAFEVGGEYLDWTGYMDAINSSLVESGSWLPYAAYAETGEAYAYPPATAKEVLEDGLLGDIQENGDYAKTEAPAHVIEQNVDGEDVVIRFVDGAAYVEGIYEIYKDGTTWTGIDKASYTVSTDGTDGILTISKNQFTAGEEHTLSIRATGYRPCAFKFTYAIVQEENLKLTAVYPEDKNAFTAVEGEVKKGEKGYIADAVFTIENSEGGFLGHLESIVLDGDNQVFHEGYEGIYSEYYELSNDASGNLTKVTIHQVKYNGTGDAVDTHTLSIRAKGYADPLTVEFHLEKDASDPEVTEKEAPAVTGFALEKASWYFNPDIYRATFDWTDEKELRAYVNAITAVTANGEELGKKSYSLGTSDSKKWAVSKSDSNKDEDSIVFTTDSFSDTEDTVVVINAEGYETVTFTVDKDKNLKEEGSELLAAPAVESTEYVEAGYWDPAYYRLTFAENDEAETYLKLVYSSDTASATVNGTEYSKNNVFWTNTKNAFRVEDELGGTNPGERYIDLTTEAFTEDINEVVIYVEGYEPLTVQVNKAGTEEPDVPGAEEAAPKVTKAEYNAERDYGYYKYPAYYNLTFEATDETLTETYLSEKVNLVTVNGEEYAKSASLEGASYAFRPSDDNYGNFRYLYLTAEAFTKEVNEVVIEADGYETQTVYITKNGELTEDSGEETLKTPPATKPTVKKDGYDGSYSLTFGMGNDEWVENINGLSVNGEAYSEGYGFSSDTEYRVSSVTDGVVKFGNGAATEDVNEIVIFADGYEALTLYITKDGELTEDGGEEETLQVPPAVKELRYQESFFSGNYWEVGFDANAKEIDAYLAADNFTLTVDGDEYERVELSFFGSLGAQEYTTGTGSYGTVLKIAAEGLDLETSHEVVITADGYENLTFTIDVESTAVADVLAELEEALSGNVALPEKEQIDADAVLPDQEQSDEAEAETEDEQTESDSTVKDTEDETAGQSDGAELPEQEEGEGTESQDADVSDAEESDDAVTDEEIDDTLSEVEQSEAVGDKSEEQDQTVETEEQEDAAEAED